jgi:hypothetical protein
MSAVVDLDRIAADTYAAMCELPAPLAALAAATTRVEREAALRAADPSVREAALLYMAAPEASRERERRLAWLRADARRLAAVKHYYATAPGGIAAFIDDYGATLDPRLLARGGSAVIPFRLFPRQRELIEFMLARYRRSEPGVVVKARDTGASWCSMALLCSLCLFNEKFAAIIGSALEVKIDQSGTSGTLLHKARMFLEYLPPEFNGGWSRDRHSAHMRIWFPNGSSIQGQAGTAIGRGERASIVLLDEAAHIEHAELIDASLAATSDVRIDISSVNGPDNAFAIRARNDAVPRFMYSWRDDPRKSEEWAARKIAADGQRRFDQEYGCDFLAGTEGQLIPREHLDACIDAHVKLGIEPTGRRFAGFDVGGGGDPSAFAVVHGNYVEHVEAWPSGTNLFNECRKAFALADKYDVTELAADHVGIGAGIEGDCAQLNAERAERDLPRLRVTAFKGSQGVLFPERPAVPGSSYKAKDYYLNRKSQAYGWLAYRAALTHRAINGDMPKNTDDLLFLNSKMPELNALLAELSQITSDTTTAGKLRIDKYGEGSSPNRADALAIATAPRRLPMNIHPDAIAVLSVPARTSWPRTGRL